MLRSKAGGYLCGIIGCDRLHNDFGVLIELHTFTIQQVSIKSTTGLSLAIPPAIVGNLPMRNPFAALRGGTIRASLAVTLCASATWLAIGAPTSPKIIKKPDYTKEIRPILGDHCLKCHGVDANARKGNLRLDQPITAAQAKEVARRIALPASSSLHMPPMNEPSQPTSAQKAPLTTSTPTGPQVDKHLFFITIFELMIT